MSERSERVEITSTDLLAQSSAFAGRASQCTDLAQWCDLNAEPETGRALRDIAAYMRYRAEKIRANTQNQALTR